MFSFKLRTNKWQMHDVKKIIQRMNKINKGSVEERIFIIKKKITDATNIIKIPEDIKDTLKK